SEASGRRPPKDGPCVALSAAAPAPQTGPQSQSPLAVCGSAEGDPSPNNTRPIDLSHWHRLGSSLHRFESQISPTTRRSVKDRMLYRPLTT
ncbi:hypothetical protein KUCAC02_019061, partial [Chaenocephalus aceratus]